MASNESWKKYSKSKKGVLTVTYQKQKARREVFYSLEELHCKFLEDKRFGRLWKEWIKHGYDLQFRPTIDRINCKKGYTLDNIQCATWAENRYKQRMELKLIRAKTVYQIQGDRVVATFKSVSHTVKETGLHQGNLSSCLNNRRKYCGGYKWSYEKPSGHIAEEETK